MMGNQSVSTRAVMSVLGPVRVEDLGPVLTHEHLLIDMTCYWQQPEAMSARRFINEPVMLGNLGFVKRNPLVNRDNCLLDDLDLAIEEVMEFKKLGGGTIVDVTLPDIGRDPRALQAAARVTGLNIVMGCGHYVHLAHPPSLADESIEDIAGRLIKEIRHGVAETGIRPGIIGEIGTSWPIHASEEKVLRAAAVAQAASGLSITLHLHPPERRGEAVLDILENGGARLDRVVAGHVDIALGHVGVSRSEVMDYYYRLLGRGCFLEFDTVGNTAYFADSGYGAPFWCPSDAERAEAIAELVREGYGDRILVAQDICHKYHLRALGGVGYGHILKYFMDDLRAVGLESTEILQIVERNPQVVLGVERPASGEET